MGQLAKIGKTRKIADKFSKNYNKCKTLSYMLIRKNFKVNNNNNNNKNTD